MQTKKNVGPWIEPWDTPCTSVSFHNEQQMIKLTWNAETVWPVYIRRPLRSKTPPQLPPLQFVRFEPCTPPGRNRPTFGMSRCNILQPFLAADSSRQSAVESPLPSEIPAKQGPWKSTRTLLDESDVYYINFDVKSKFKMKYYRTVAYFFGKNLFNWWYFE